jgi:folate-dependent tRNA-U54 methylase TrmFO/GidA
LCSFVLFFVEVATMGDNDSVQKALHDLASAGADIAKEQASKFAPLQEALSSLVKAITDEQERNFAPMKAAIEALTADVQRHDQQVCACGTSIP